MEFGAEVVTCLFIAGARHKPQERSSRDAVVGNIARKREVFSTTAGWLPHPPGTNTKQSKICIN